MTDEEFMQKAIDLASENVKAGVGGPFGAVIVKNGQIVAEATNTVTSTNDSTAHAEVNAIRKACANLKTFDLSGCVIYSSCEPCPMCLSALYWAHVDKIYISATKRIAAKAGFDDAFIYKELDTPKVRRRVQQVRLLSENGNQPFDLWNSKTDKIEY